ncbi:glycoside-pentoside-hexuronide (GPH):cation symporter [Paenibacillus sp. MMS20-IR301]|uniref:MFS transporter n=1 Tax=Paenibacillus sp. MMS20-IR301 TaxID=2895946 RepID=UPI0028EBA059|nr:glycoside-pentoside-hexuronide (GPH):cation symporter [Paenibacillus sp. MMS20-IR301]WNS44629.1 glycoside-pentoside-hexuronide (GPH):cation symporter [Paenibacillus sp. MMS20-IR301]
MTTKVPLAEKMAFSSGLLGQNMLYSFMSMYILFFYTDLLGIPATTASFILVAASIFDACLDPVMGMITDKTRSRWGKFRPYLLFAPFLIAAATALCFWDPGSSSQVTLVIATVSYLLWGLLYTVCDTPLWALSSVISTDPGERTLFVTLGKIGGTLGAVVITVGGIQLLLAFGGERSTGAYLYSAIIIGVIAASSIFFTGLLARERVIPSAETIPFRENLQTVYKNKPLLTLLAALLIINLVNGIRQSIQLYYVVYVWGDAGYATQVGISLVVGMLLGMIATPPLLRRFSKKKVFIVSCVLGSLSCILPYFLGDHRILPTLIFFAVSFFFSGMTTIVSTSMLLDTIDYSEWKLGFRGEGIVFSTNTFITKFSGALSRLIIGASLGLLSYVENQPATPQLQNGLSFVMFLLPALCFLAAILPILFYNISDRQRIQILSDLEKSRAV